uniref:Secreted protein n=1 Tax=Gasterosteus aculeatus TaxID=69293 RepID=G3NB13_GASAC
MSHLNVLFFVCLSLSDGMAMFSPVSLARYRRSSVSINPSGPSQVTVCLWSNDKNDRGRSVVWLTVPHRSLQLVPLSPFSATAERPDHKRQVSGPLVLVSLFVKVSLLSLLWV